MLEFCQIHNKLLAESGELIGKLIYYGFDKIQAFGDTVLSSIAKITSDQQNLSFNRNGCVLQCSFS